NEYSIVREAGGEVYLLLEQLRMDSSDTSRTPMQWDANERAGFKAGTPWYPVNPNYVDINVAQKEQEQKSILKFYKELIRLKKSDDIYTYGKFDLVDADNG
ncbi:glucohydrolase, partial [Staphylococcus pseudintermedius]|uniref:alpha-amylase family glycosyl hydrolase n=1 Tax=Staphylococcus pseudintermedius TaxID=283734 RepID=UPI000E3821EB